MDASIARKMLIKNGKTIVLINEPEGYEKELTEILPEGSEIIPHTDGPADIVHLFVIMKSDLDTWLEKAVSFVKDGSLLWLSYPKKSSKVPSDLNRDILHGLMKERGWEGISLVSIDDIWSAMRFKKLS